jgi:hypothetical protein
MDAIQEYLCKEYGIDLDLYKSLSEAPCISATETEYPIKKHKNGKLMKDKDGIPIRDFKNPKVLESHFNFYESDKITIYLEPGVNHDR